jgi:hypothetical protein
MFQRTLFPLVIVVASLAGLFVGVSNLDGVLASVEMTNDAAPKAVAARLVELPDDGETYTASLFVHKDWESREDEKAMVAEWQQLPETLRLQAPCSIFIYAEDHPVYRERFAQFCPRLPAVMIQTASGRVIFKDFAVSVVRPGRIFPLRPVVLPWNRVVDRRPSPGPGPGPCPQPKPVLTPNVDVKVAIPDKVGPAKPLRGEDRDFWGVLIVACSLAGLLTGGLMFARQVHGSPIVD